MFSKIKNHVKKATFAVIDKADSELGKFLDKGEGMLAN